MLLQFSSELVGLLFQKVIAAIAANDRARDWWMNQTKQQQGTIQKEETKQKQTNLA